MPERTDLVVIGAGPAGMAAAACAAQRDLRVLLIDEQPAAGGQIYRGLDYTDRVKLEVLGPDYPRGRELLDGLAQPGIRCLPESTVWQVTREREVFISRNGEADVVVADRIVLATGAMERAMPFPGWTRAGVMNAGAGQILLKGSALIPDDNAVLAGSGPLLYLLAWQYLQAGVKVGAILETTPRSNLIQAMVHLPGALRANAYLRKGIGLLRAIRRSRVPHFRGVTALRALGSAQVESVAFESGGNAHALPCSILLLHQGVVPNVQITRSLGLEHDWAPLPRCWHPRVSAWGETAIEGIYVAGDGGGIGGAEVAAQQGRLAALHAAQHLGAISVQECESQARPVRRHLAYHLAVRSFLDTLYSPAREYLCPSNETIICRCEEVTAGSVREYVRLGCLGPNQTKAFGRPGMGPCQGRLCGLTVSEVIAGARGVSPAEVGYYRVRPPIKPITLGELATLPLPDEQQLEAQDIG